MYGRQKRSRLGPSGQGSLHAGHMYKFVVWLFREFVSKFIFIHVDLHIGFPAGAAQADSFSAAHTPQVSSLPEAQESTLSITLPAIL